MLSVEKLIRERFPAFAAKPALVRQPVVKALQWILREKQVNDFVRFVDGRRGLAYNDGIVEYFQLGYRTYGCEQIPASGPLVIVATFGCEQIPSSAPSGWLAAGDCGQPSARCAGWCGADPDGEPGAGRCADGGERYPAAVFAGTRDSAAGG